MASSSMMSVTGTVLGAQVLSTVAKSPLSINSYRREIPELERERSRKPAPEAGFGMTEAYFRAQSWCLNLHQEDSAPSFWILRNVGSCYRRPVGSQMGTIDIVFQRKERKGRKARKEGLLGIRPVFLEEELHAALAGNGEHGRVLRQTRQEE